MDPLPSKDLEKLLRCIAAVQEPVSVADFPVLVFRLVGELAPGDHMVYRVSNARWECLSEIDSAPFRCSATQLSDVCRAFESYRHEHPLFAHYATTRDPSVLRFSDFLPRRAWEATTLFNEHHRVLGIRRTMGFAVHDDGEIIVRIGVNRTGARDFSNREIQLTELFRPHLAAAYRNVHLQQDLSRVLQDGNAVLVVDPDQRIVFASDRAHCLLRDFWGAMPARLPEALRNWLRHPAGEGSEPVLRIRQGARVVEFKQARSGRQVLLFPTMAASAVQVAEGRLTARERDVLRWLVQGRTNSAIGLILSISGATVKKHVEHIFTKLGAGNRTEAALFAAETGCV